jgi:3-hydroxyisobutyrate dehydrogenase-like beta-hydroxyacid dehydrogenase
MSFREAITKFAAAGARVADSDVCKGNDVVLTMLVEDSAVIDVVLRRRRHA